MARLTEAKRAEMAAEKAEKASESHWHGMLDEMLSAAGKDLAANEDEDPTKSARVRFEGPTNVKTHLGGHHPIQVSPKGNSWKAILQKAVEARDDEENETLKEKLGRSSAEQGNLWTSLSAKHSPRHLPRVGGGKWKALLLHAAEIREQEETPIEGVAGEEREPPASKSFESNRVKSKAAPVTKNTTVVKKRPSLAETARELLKKEQVSYPDDLKTVTPRSSPTTGQSRLPLSAAKEMRWSAVKEILPEGTEAALCLIQREIVKRLREPETPRGAEGLLHEKKNSPCLTKARLIPTFNPSSILIGRSESDEKREPR